MKERIHSFGLQRFGLLLLVAFSALAAGCAERKDWFTPRQAGDFESAESIQRRTGRSVLFVYFDSRTQYDKPLRKSLVDAGVKEKIGDMIRCSLYRPYEPDRRFVAQFRVERAPALIVAHADGTYHAFVDPPTPERIQQFLDQSTKPGVAAARDERIARDVRYEWMTDLDAAMKEASRCNRSLLAVLYRGGSRDWNILTQMLERPEVFRRFDGWVHARVSGWVGAPRDAMTRLGVENVPALVIVRADGSSSILPMPGNYEAIVRFADEAGRVASGSAGISTAAAESP